MNLYFITFSISFTIFAAISYSSSMDNFYEAEKRDSLDDLVSGISSGLTSGASKVFHALKRVVTGGGGSGVSGINLVSTKPPERIKMPSIRNLTSELSEKVKTSVDTSVSRVQDRVTTIRASIRCRDIIRRWQRRASWRNIMQMGNNGCWQVAGKKLYGNKIANQVNRNEWVQVKPTRRGNLVKNRVVPTRY